MFSSRCIYIYPIKFWTCSVYSSPHCAGVRYNASVMVYICTALQCQ